MASVSSRENNVIKSVSSKAETMPYQQVPSAYPHTTDRFSTNSTTEAYYSVNQQPTTAALSDYNTGTDTETQTSHQFHHHQTNGGLADQLQNPTSYNHDRVLPAYQQNQGVLHTSN